MPFGIEKSYNCKSTSSGYTLLEVLVSLAISGVLMVSLGSMTINGWRAYQRIDELSELQENARTGIAMITKDIRLSQDLLLVEGSELSMAASDGSSLVYRVSGGVLYRVSKGTSNPVCLNVSSFEVQEDSPGSTMVHLGTTLYGKTYVLHTRANRYGD